MDTLLSEDLSDSTHRPDSVSEQRLYFVPYRWWKDAKDSVLRDSEGKRGILYAASAATSIYAGPMKIINNIFNSDLAFNLRREEDSVGNGENGEAGISGRDFALVSGEMWVEALKWHSDSKSSMKEGRSFSAAEDDMADVYPLQLRLSVLRETNSQTNYLGVRISKKDNATEFYKRACKIFSVELELLRIWDFSGQTNLFLLNDKITFPRDCQRQSDEILLDLQVYRLSDSIKCRDGKKDEMVGQHSSMAYSSSTSIMMNGNANKENTSELFEIESILHDLRQGDMTVTQYFNTLTRYWQQVDMCEEHSWKCPEDGVKYRQIVEKKRVYKFLFGLNKNLDEVRGRIQGMRPQLSLRDAFSEVRREESRKKVMLGTQAITPQLENSALAARTDTRQRRERPYCEHCRKPGHTKETCWKIHGKPADWKPSRPQNRGNTAVKEEDSVSAESNLFSKEQLEILKQLIQQSQAANSTQTIGTGSLAHRGQGGDAMRSYFQGQRPDTKITLEKQNNSDTRSQRKEDVDIGYEENPASQTFQSLEQKFHDEITKLAEEQNDAEDAENARHREKINAINAQYTEQLAALRAQHANRRDEFLWRESSTRHQQYQQAVVDCYPNNSSSIGPNDSHDYGGFAVSTVAAPDAHRGYNNEQYDSYRERARFLGGGRDHGFEPRGSFPGAGGRVYDTGSRYY